jgi:hypothetical protein
MEPAPLSEDMQTEDVCVARALVGRLRNIADRAARRMQRRMQRAWRRCVSDPAYTVCKARLMFEFKEMSEWGFAM